MKKTVISSLVVLSLLLLSSCSPKVLLNKSPESQNVVLSSFRFHVQHFNQDALYSGDFASLLVSVSPRSMFNADLTMIHPLYNKEQNKFIKAEVDSTYNIIQKHLNKLNFNLLPANTLKGDTKFDPYGYPIDAKPEKAFKKANLALQVNIFLDENFVNRNYAYPYLFQVSYTPRITLIIKMVDSSGKTVWSQQTVTNADTSVVIDDRIEGGIRRLSVNQMPALSDIINKAMKEMLK